MAETYHRDTRVKNANLYLGYRCSRCGERQVIAQPFSGYSVATDRGVLTERGLERRRERADREAQKDLEKKLADVRRKLRGGDYRSLGVVRYACRSCGNTEPWFAMHSDVHAAGKMVSGILAVLFLIIWAFVALFGGSGIVWLSLTGLAAASFAAFHIADRIHCRKVEQSFAGLPPESFPAVLETREELVAYNVDPFELLDWPPGKN